MKRFITSALITFSAAVLLSACGSSSSSGGGGTGPDTTAPQVLSAPDILPLGNNQGIVIVFDEAMDTGTLVLGGSLAGGNGGIWSNTTTTDDTLTISPTAMWALGEGQTFSMDADNLAGNPLATLNLTFNVYAGTLYFVSSSATDDSGDGLTPATAKQTMQAAIDIATDPASVIVNAGTYNVDSGAGTHVIMKEGVSLIGGYNNGYTEFDRATNVTIITDTSTAANDFNTTHKAIEAGTGITVATEIDGFTINGGGGDYSAAIDCSSASPLIENNIIDGGSGNVSYGINVYPSGAPVIQYNTISGGSAGNSSRGIYDGDSATIHMNTVNGGSGATGSKGISTGSGATSSIHHNNINGGTGGSTGGIYNVLSNATIHSNTIHGGTPSNAGGSSGGVRSWYGNPQIRNNVIYGGTGAANSTGVSNSAGTIARIERNTIYSGDVSLSSYGVTISSASPIIINNTIHAGTGGLQSLGINNFRSDAIIRNNTIDGGAGSPSYGIKIWDAPGPVIENNIIFSTSTGTSNCIFEDTFDVLPSDDPLDGDPAVLRNNSLTSCTNVYVDQDAACTGDGDGDGDDMTCTFTEMQALSDIPSFGGNVQIGADFVDADGADNDPNTMEDNDWHLAGTTSASVSDGGINGSNESVAWSFTDDKDGVARGDTGSWSIGAYEP